MSPSLEPWLQHSPGCASFNLYDNGRSRECDCGLDAARAEGRPSPEVAFLLDRLADFEAGGLESDAPREWHGHVAPAIARLRAALSMPSPERAEGAPAAWKCGAIANLEDCGWPFCGCDPMADKVLSAIQEHDMLIVPNTLSADAEPVAVSREEIAGIIRDHVSLTCGIHCERMMSSDDERQCEFDAADAIISRIGGPSPEAGREEDLRAEVLAIFKANKMATDERLAILIAERLAPRLSPPAPEPGYEAGPVGWGIFNPDTSAWRANVFFKQELAGKAYAERHSDNYTALEPRPLYASPVPVSREEIAEEIWRRFAPSYEETFAECANRSEYLLAADAILQRLSNQQGGE